MARHIAIVVAALFLAAAGADGKVITKVEQGRLNAIEACSACHQVRPEQARRPPVHDDNFDMDVQPPSFMEIANTHGTDVEYLRQHIAEPEWPMREQMMDNEYLGDIILYIQSLKAHPKLIK